MKKDGNEIVTKNVLRRSGYVRRMEKIIIVNRIFESGCSGWKEKKEMVR